MNFFQSVTQAYSEKKNFRLLPAGVEPNLPNGTSNKTASKASARKLKTARAKREGNFVPPLKPDIYFDKRDRN